MEGPCTECEGTGKQTDGVPCTTCDGTGTQNIVTGYRGPHRPRKPVPDDKVPF